VQRETAGRVSKHNAPNRGTTSRCHHCADSTLNLGFCPKTPTNQVGKCQHTSTTPPRRRTTPTDTIAAGTDQRRARISSVVPHITHTTHQIGAVDLVVHTATTATPCRHSHHRWSVSSQHIHVDAIFRSEPPPAGTMPSHRAAVQLARPKEPRSGLAPPTHPLLARANKKHASSSWEQPVAWTKTRPAALRAVVASRVWTRVAAPDLRRRTTAVLRCCHHRRALLLFSASPSCRRASPTPRTSARLTTASTWRCLSPSPSPLAPAKGARRGAPTLPAIFDSRVRTAAAVERESGKGMFF
jgi:hypothetical protein